MKWILIGGLVAVLVALASAGAFMLRKPPRDADPAAPPDKRMANALAWRVGLSVALFLFILLAYALGWIEPHGIVR